MCVDVGLRGAVASAVVMRATFIIESLDDLLTTMHQVSQRCLLHRSKRLRLGGRAAPKWANLSASMRSVFAKRPEAWRKSLARFGLMTATAISGGGKRCPTPRSIPPVDSTSSSVTVSGSS